VKPIGGDRQDEPLKLYLTKKERKRVRRTAREERELEKRDKMLMGLIPTPEPKFKLSNFMKILGDQAVADPSKVEKRVIQQMQQRRLNHEMRNLAKKLTPAEKKEKKRRKLQEDTSRQVQVAIFRVKDFSDPKHRFKVDVNIQQLNLTGTGSPLSSSVPHMSPQPFFVPQAKPISWWQREVRKELRKSSSS
jgi:U4/U6 small nuclear ribonucleoprotein PRP3